MQVSSDDIVRKLGSSCGVAVELAGNHGGINGCVHVRKRCRYFIPCE